jgi:UDP-4-amino-4,6-dideoxy-N-acetyl-beta-L-altrosamine transaminase
MTQRVRSYGRQLIDEADIASVVEVLTSEWLTTGPMVDAFEAALSKVVGADHAVVCNSGTAALHLAMKANDMTPGDAIVVPAITFVATANAAILAGLEVVFADVDPTSGLMGIEHIGDALRRIGRSRVKAVCPVHLGGRTEDPAELARFATDHGLAVIEDACHALGTEYGNGTYHVGSCAHSNAACFSFHPVKTITMGEGGAITTNSATMAEKMRQFRAHGVSRRSEDMSNRDMAFGATGTLNPWYYEVAEISHNFRASDINCALGLSQLLKLSHFIAVRRALMARYTQQLAPLAPGVRLTSQHVDVNPGWHLCSVLIDFDDIGIDRATLMQRLKDRGIGTQVHYIPVHSQPYYRERYGVQNLPGASVYYSKTLTLPLTVDMTIDDVDSVVHALKQSIA